MLKFLKKQTKSGAPMEAKIKPQSWQQQGSRQQRARTLLRHRLTTTKIPLKWQQSLGEAAVAAAGAVEANVVAEVPDVAAEEAILEIIIILLLNNKTKVVEVRNLTRRVKDTHLMSPITRAPVTGRRGGRRPTAPTLWCAPGCTSSPLVNPRPEEWASLA